MHRFLFALIFIFLLAKSEKTMASHLAGADISYKSLGVNKFEITAHIYRDCKGIAFSNPSLGSYAGTNGGNGCPGYTLSISRTSIRDISVSCPYDTKPCSPANTNNTGRGIEEHTYVCIADLTQSPLNNYLNKSSCCEVTFYIGQCCRSGSITTGPAGSDLWATTTINICNIKSSEEKTDNGPQWDFAPQLYMHCNKAYRTSWSCTDADGDSLVYKLSRGINTLPATSIYYSSPFTYQYPVTCLCNPSSSIKCTPIPNKYPLPYGFFLDTQTGFMAFTPTKCDEVAVLCVQVYSYRKTNGKWTFMGKSTRDITTYVQSEDPVNDPPVIQIPDNLKVWNGDTLRFDVTVSDTMASKQTSADTPTLDFRKIAGLSIENISRSGGNSVYHFRYFPDIKDTMDHTVWLATTANDQHCSKPLTTSLTKKIRVLLRDSIFCEMENGFCNFRLNFRTQSHTDVMGYGLEIHDSAKIFSYQNNYLLNGYCGPYLNKVTKFYYHLESHLSNGKILTKTDSFIAREPKYKKILPNDTGLCQKSKINIVSAKMPGSNNTTTWYINNVKQGNSSDTLTLYNISGPLNIFCKLTDVCGCEMADTMIINTFLKPAASFTTQQSFAYVSSPVFNTINFSSIAAPGKMSFFWKFGAGSGIYNDTSSAISPVITYDAIAAKHNCVLKVTSDMGCIDTFAKILEVKNNVKTLDLKTSDFQILPGIVVNCDHCVVQNKIILDMAGRKITETSDNNYLELPAGIYVVYLHLKNNSGQELNYCFKYANP